MSAAELIALVQAATAPGVDRISEQLSKVTSTIAEIDEKVVVMDRKLVVQDQRLNDLEKSIDERIERAMAAARPVPVTPRAAWKGAPSPSRSDSSASSVSDATTADPAEWRPTNLLVRGWAPHGAPTSDRIGREAAAALGNRLLMSLPEQERACLRMAPPFAGNYQLVFRQMRGDIWRTRDLMAGCIEKESIEIRGVLVKVAVEISPERRRRFGAFFDAKRELQAVCDGAETLWLTDPRAMQIILPDYSTVGAMPKAGDFRWHLDGLAKLGLEVAQGALRKKAGTKRPAGADDDDAGEDAAADTAPDGMEM